MSIAPRYYYLDDSMGKDFDKIFKTAQFWASCALKRLDDASDSEFREIFRKIFKTSVSDMQPMPRSPRFQPWFSRVLLEGDQLQPLPVLAHVRRELLSFAYGWTRTSHRARAEVRIHWDGKGRWVQEGPELFCDPINDMVLRDSEEEMNQSWSQSHASVVNTRQVYTTNDQHTRRNVIEFSERARKEQISWEACAGAELNGIPVDWVASKLLETTLIHEMMHCEAYDLQDFYNDRGETAGWHLIMGLTKEESYICAESIAMLCLAAALADLEPVGLPSRHSYTISSDGIITVYQRNIFRDCASG
ncbi:hypothetical protein F5883DRAFT_636174 [Diaporthe sp. PMI_573]|nr:hypothetical protein F5883DRAFT_636174 [Diaporthaceae sp. PMI_573]